MHPVTPETLSAFADGDLDQDPAARREVEAHVAGCAECVQILAELAELKALALEAREAPRRKDLWPAISEELSRPTLVDRLRGLFARPIVGWAAAAIVAVVAVGQATVGARSEMSPAKVIATVADARRGYVAAIGRLEGAARDADTQLPEEVRHKLARNLADVDRAIAECERILAATPDDPDGQQLLLAMYDEKIRILDAAIEAAESRKRIDR